MIREQEWVAEKWEDVETHYRIKSTLYEGNSEYQHMKVVDSCLYGRMFLLDGIVQTTEKDEFIYHEMMSHIPLLSHPAPESVLIIGGGDGGILREVLRYRSVKQAAIVEIDSHVINICKEYLPMINNGAFKDKRAEVVIADGARFVKETTAKYDVVIVDSSDPVGPATVLFSREFYSDIHNILSDSGIMVCQTGSLHMQPDEQRDSYTLLKDSFHIVRPYLFAVPTYVGGFFSAMFCSDKIDPCKTEISSIEKKIALAGIKTGYYNPGMHLSVFTLPGFLNEHLL
ncbi:MAG: polyamine aminopropyltransferase [Deltaproteobacteria bacterium]|nr:polyamine aminopropyltransferase [Deltaproteobacteria bacterium]